jgi:hypothetical protein
VTAEPDRVRLALAVHEAGHAVAHVLLGGTVRGISIEMNAADGARRGACFFGGAGDELPLPSPVQVAFQMPTSARIRLERELAAALAGPIAQSTFAPLLAELELPARDEEHVREVIERRHAVLEQSASKLLDAEDEFTDVRSLTPSAPTKSYRKGSCRRRPSPPVAAVARRRSSARLTIIPYRNRLTNFAHRAHPVDVAAESRLPRFRPALAPCERRAHGADSNRAPSLRIPDRGCT